VGQLLRVLGIDQERMEEYERDREVVLHADERLSARIRRIVGELGVELVCGKHWTTDAIYRTTFEKVERYCERGVNLVDMELAALAARVPIDICIDTSVYYSRSERLNGMPLVRSSG